MMTKMKVLKNQYGTILCMNINFKSTLHLKWKLLYRFSCGHRSILRIEPAVLFIDWLIDWLISILKGGNYFIICTWVQCILVLVCKCLFFHRSYLSMTAFNVIARTIAINTNTFKDAKQQLNITPMYETEDSLHAISKGNACDTIFFQMEK